MGNENESQGQKISPYASPLHNFGSSIILMTNPDEEIYKMELAFRSMYQDKDGNIHVTGDPLMNDLGINAITGIVQSLVSRLTIMSNINDNEVRNLMDFLGDTLSRDLMMNRIKYDIKTVSARDKIYFTALSTAFVTLKRGFEEGEKRFWKGSQMEITNRMEGGNEKKGFLSNILGWGK